jgi:hypothetical protein
MAERTASIGRFRGRAHRVELSVAKLLARHLQLDLLKRSMYSPIPNVPPPESPFWRRTSELVGLELDLDAQLFLLESKCAPYLAEFKPPLGPPDADGFYLRNGWYGSVDAELLYAMVRRFRPRQLLEIGSGMSTEVSATAALANRHDGHDTELFAIDPEPPVELTRTTREPLRTGARSWSPPDADFATGEGLGGCLRAGGRPRRKAAAIGRTIPDCRRSS